MAQIYLARQTGLGAFERHVVLKTILRERASDQRFVTMFLDEAKLAATLNHQNIAQVYEVDQADGAYFMAMEYVHGENARAILETTMPPRLDDPARAGDHDRERRGGGAASRARAPGQERSAAQHRAPRRSPAEHHGRLRRQHRRCSTSASRRPRSARPKTVGGTIKGKYGYMSPEQCKGKPIDRRSDIFALGIVLYELTDAAARVQGQRRLRDR
jgi:serine/threonine-protein kinase